MLGIYGGPEDGGLGFFPGGYSRLGFIGEESRDGEGVGFELLFLLEEGFALGGDFGAGVVGAVYAVYACEDGLEGVVVGLGDGVELVIVAAGAVDG